MGPLHGIKILEFTGIGPGPFCGMVLADLGADVLRIDRKETKAACSQFEVLHRSRPAIAMDLKSERGRELALRLMARSDALIEGFRPGVMERLGLGPGDCLSLNPRLVYGRITGWGQTGPLSHAAGHDINYISLSGALHAIGPEGGKPVPPLNLVGDFGGGGMLLALGIVSAILETSRSGKGQVVDAAMTDGAALLMAPIYGMKAAGRWTNQRGANFLDGGAHYYDSYECSDGKFISIGSIEPQFYAMLLDKLGIPSAGKAELTAIFKTRTREEWCALMEGSDICFAPVLDLDEAPHHAHNSARGTFVTVAGVPQPAPAPRFSRTQPEPPTAPPVTGEIPETVLALWGLTADEV